MSAPKGNQNAAKGKRWEAAITRALEAYPNPPTDEGKSQLMIALDKAAYAFVSNLFENKELSYFKELGDRLDGKPAQAIVGDPEQPVSVAFGWMKPNS